MFCLCVDPRQCGVRYNNAVALRGRKFICSVLHHPQMENLHRTGRADEHVKPFQSFVLENAPLSVCLLTRTDDEWILDSDANREVSRNWFNNFFHKLCFFRRMLKACASFVAAKNAIVPATAWMIAHSGDDA